MTSSLDTTLVVFAVIALVAVTALCITLAFVAVRALREIERAVSTLEDVGSDVREMKQRVLPVMDDALMAMRNVAMGTATLRAMTEDVRTLEQQVVNRIRPTVDDITGAVSGAVRVISSLIRAFRK